MQKQEKQFLRGLTVILLVLYAFVTGGLAQFYLELIPINVEIVEIYKSVEVCNEQPLNFKVEP